jgi:L-rhamnose isomerase / sugar isomerase
VQAHLVDRKALAEYQETNDPLMALQSLKLAYTTDVAPILATARLRAGGAIDPIGAYRSSGYRRKKISERPATARSGAGIV